ncbi:MAG: phosphate ABC transporter substrate-binding protein [Acidobacteriota bacterium]|nr:MAG: phosphate ABC transporter substrate-binding protein [Acidobacteriota bacterium]
MISLRNLFTTAALAFLVSCGPPREPGASGSGRAVIQNKGSDTLVNVAQGWAEAYQNVNPDVAVAVSGGGSGTGFAALINGTVDIANASRKLKDSELEQARANGHEPVEFIVGYDALAVYVHADNPLESLTLARIADIYAEGGSSESWTDVGVEVPGCANQELVRVSRQNNSGTYAYFRKAVLGNQDYKLGSRDMHGSKDVVDLVERTPCAIGYSGLAYKTDHVKVLCVAADEDSECVNPSIESALDGTYPIARPLFMYTRGEPQGPVKEYMDWILSDEGQCIILDKGYAPAKPVTCGSGSGESSQ